MGGVEWSICDGRYDEALIEICSESWSCRWRSLEAPAERWSFEITVTEPEGEPLVLGPDEYQYDPETNRVRLACGWNPAAGSTMEVRYRPRRDREVSEPL